jgi:cytidylate kinase
MLITISRQYGAGGSEVARRVAAALGWRVVDNELVEQVAVRAGLPPERVAEREERVSTFVERLARTLAAASPEVFPTDSAGGSDPPEAELVKITGRSCRRSRLGRVVLWAAPRGVLQTDALHVKLVAPRAFRIQVCCARLGCSAAHAATVLDDTDKMRARYSREYYRRDWNDPVNFHMVLNTGVLGFDGATEVIVGRARAMRWGSGAGGLESPERSEGP